MGINKMKIVVVLAVGLIAAGVGAFAARGQQGADAPRSPEKAPQPLADLYGDPLPDGALARMGSVRFRQNSPVVGLAFSPDGRFLASQSWRGNLIHVWDFSTGREVHRFPVAGGEEGSQPGTMVFSADSKVLFLLTDWAFLAWEVKSGEKIEKLAKLKERNFKGIAPHGKMVATAAKSNLAIHLWDAETGKEVRQLPLTNSPRDLIFSGDARYVASKGDDSLGQFKFRVWDLATGKELWEATESQADIRVLSHGRFSPDGKVLTGVKGSELHILEAATGKELWTANKPEERILAFTPDGKGLYMVNDTGSLRLVESATGKELQRWEGKLPHWHRKSDVVLSPDGKTLAFSVRNYTFASHTIQFVDMAAWKKVKTFGDQESPIHSLAFSPDDKTLLSLGSDHTVRQWEKATGKGHVVHRFFLGNAAADFLIDRVVFSPDGKLIAVVKTDFSVNAKPQNSGGIHFHETATGKEVHKIQLPNTAIYSLAFSADWKVLASAWFDGVLRFHDPAQGQKLGQFKVHEPLQISGLGADGRLFFNGQSKIVGPVLGLALAPGGKTLAVLYREEKKGADQTTTSIRLWEVATGKERRRFPIKELAQEQDFEPIKGDLVFSPRGRTAAFGRNNIIHLYDIVWGKERRSFGGPGVISCTAAFSADGKHIAAGTSEGTVQVWEVDSGALVCQLSGHQSAINAVVFAADGKTLATAGDDTTALVWDLAAKIEKFEKSRPGPAILPAEKIESLWTDLAGEDEKKADRAVQALAVDPSQTVPYLKKRLEPAAAVDPKTIEKDIAQLNSEEFVERDKAMQALEKHERVAEKALRQALDKGPASLEQRRRLERLLQKLEGPEKLEWREASPDVLRGLRALEVLEQIGSAPAREVLEALAKGAPEARLTREAQAALERLSFLEEKATR